MRGGVQVKDVLILRTHQRGAELDEASARYRALAGLDLVVAADERRGDLAMPHGIEKVSLSDPIIEGMGLAAVRNWGWLCGDYTLYAVRNAKPHYERYWLIEPDVRINAADLDAFFDRFAALSDDFLASRLGNRTMEWWHHAAMAHFRPDVAGCLFPFVRVSGAAVDYLLQRRVEFSRQWRTARQNGSPIPWPNDEAFVATELRHAGFACSDLNAHGHKVYGSGFSVQVPVHHHAHLFAQPDGLVYHPVLDDGGFLARLRRVLKAGRRPMGEVIDAALASVPRNPGPHEIETGLIADGTLAILLDKTRADATVEDVAAVAAKHFGGGAPGAPIHQAVLEKNKRGWAISNPGDFVRGPEVAAQVFPLSRATAYAADFEARELHFTCCSTDAPLLAAPFFYQAQRKHALSVTRVAFDRLADIYPDTERDDLRPLIVMSIGRCGSTLLNRLLVVDGSVAVSEPDVFSQAAGLAGRGAGHFGRPEQQVRDDAKAVLRATVQSLRTWADVPADRLVVKLRSQANGAAEQIATAFPQARFVFVFRELEGWVRSFVRAFGHAAPMLVRNLATGVRACNMLRRRGVDLTVVSYEALITNPADNVQRVLMRQGGLTRAQVAMIETVVSQDSQAGTSISRASRRQRESTSCDDEQQTWTEFRALWAEKRPAAAITALGLPY